MASTGRACQLLFFVGAPGSGKVDAHNTSGARVQPQNENWQSAAARNRLDGALSSTSDTKLRAARRTPPCTTVQTPPTPLS